MHKDLAPVGGWPAGVNIRWTRVIVNTDLNNWRHEVQVDHGLE